MEDWNNINILASNKIFCGGKNYRYFIGCLYDDYKMLYINASKNESICKRLWWEY